MSSPAKTILFISHEASRTGAPIILMNFLKWLKDNTSTQFQILSKNHGELEQEMLSLAPVCYYNRNLPNSNDIVQTNNRRSRMHNLIRNIGYWSRLNNLIRKIHLHRLKSKLIRDNIGLIYSNTITNGEVLQFLSDLNCPVITHVHELEFTIVDCGRDNWDKVKNCTNHYITVSEAVKRNLVDKHNIPEERIDVVYGFIPLSTIRGSNSENGVRRSLNIPEDALIVGSSGFGTWRKGKDLFVQLALNVVRNYGDGDVHFVWIGGRTDKTELLRTMHDIDHAGLSGRVHFIDHVVNPLDYYREFDIFAMISREDPFPLVNLELAALGKPIICFDNAGGTPEFVGDDAGFVVPYLDISAMAEKIVLLARNKELRKELGHKSYAKVVANHDISVGANKVLNVIERFLT